MECLQTRMQRWKSKLNDHTPNSKHDLNKLCLSSMTHALRKLTIKPVKSALGEEDFFFKHLLLSTIFIFHPQPVFFWGKT